MIQERVKRVLFHVHIHVDIANDVEDGSHHAFLASDLLKAAIRTIRTPISQEAV